MVAHEDAHLECEKKQNNYLKKERPELAPDPEPLTLNPETQARNHAFLRGLSVLKVKSAWKFANLRASPRLGIRVCGVGFRV